jgi:hypothetical protein
MRIIGGIFAVLFSAITLSACGAVSDYSKIGAGKPPPPQLAAVLEQCRTAARVEVFEGLPHPMFEKESLAREQRRRDVLQNNGFGFYTPALTMTRRDRERLIAGVSAESSFMRWKGPKFCGGFHPDLLVRFHQPSGAPVDVHLCFGCGEAMFYAAGVQVHVDIYDAQSDDWEGIQKRYQKKRPPGKMWQLQADGVPLRSSLN